MTDTGSQTPQSDDEASFWKIASKHIVTLSAILSAAIISIALVRAASALSNDDCTTTTTRYADGRFVSERICE